MASKKMILSPEEKEIERMILAGETRRASDKEQARYVAAAKRGGARPGAGRKPTGHIPTVLALDPAVRDYLVKEAGGKTRGMSAVVNRVFGAKLKRAKAVL